MKASHFDGERSTSLEEALSSIPTISQALLEKKNIRLDFQKDAEIATVLAFSADGSLITSGFGKGPHAEVGAFGECVEHLHAFFDAPSTDSSSTFSFQDRVIRHGLRLSEGNSRIVTRTYGTFNGGEEHELPLSLTNHAFLLHHEAISAEDNFFLKYSSSSGTAYGAIFSDAALHAGLEVVERHEISKLFLSFIGQCDEERVYFSPVTLDEEVTRAIALLQANESVSEFSTIMCRSPLGPYFSFSTISSHYVSEGKVWGAGCSYSPNLALLRSVSECRQMMSEKSRDFFKQINPIIDKFPGLSPLRKIVLPIVDLIDINDVEMLSTEEQLRILQKDIGETGRNILYRVHDSVSREYVVVTVYIEDTEKFFNVVHSVPVLPLARLDRRTN